MFSKLTTAAPGNYNKLREQSCALITALLQKRVAFPVKCVSFEPINDEYSFEVQYQLIKGQNQRVEFEGKFKSGPFAPRDPIGLVLHEELEQALPAKLKALWDAK